MNVTFFLLICLAELFLYSQSLYITLWLPRPGDIPIFQKVNGRVSQNLKSKLRV